MLIALNLKGLSRMGSLFFQLDRDVFSAQPSVHRVTELRSERADHRDVLVHLLLEGHGPTLGLPPEVPLHLQLLQDLAGLLISRGIPLQQLVSLLFELGNLLLIQLGPRRQILEHPVGLLRVLTRLGLPLLGRSKLGGHGCSQLGLLGEAIPLHLLLTEELGFILATSNKNLKRKKTGTRNAKTQKHTKKEESPKNT